MQLLLTLVVGLLAVPFGVAACISALVAGGASLMASTLSVILAFRPYRAQHLGRVVVRFYQAELVRIAVLIGCVGVAFTRYEGLSIPALVIAYLVVQIGSAVIWAQTDGQGRLGKESTDVRDD